MSGVPRAIVWDLDGTLIDSASDIGDALNVLLREHGREAHPAEAVREMIGDGVAALIERGFAHNGSAVTRSDAEGLVDRFMAIYAERATCTTRPYPGVVDTLDELSKRGVVHGICTNKPFRVSAQIVAALGLADHFQAIVGGDSTTAKKPDAMPLRSCLQQLGASASDAVMIGDSVADVGAARAAGVPVVLVTFGYSRAPVTALGADALVDRLDQIPALLAQGRLRAG